MPRGPFPNVTQFLCDNCSDLEQCPSCQALERAFQHADIGRDWPSWARDQRTPEAAGRLLRALAKRVDPHGFVHDSLEHFATDAGIPREDPALLRTRWAWDALRQLVRDRLVEISANRPDLPTGVLWVRLCDPWTDRYWRAVTA